MCQKYYKRNRIVSIGGSPRQTSFKGSKTNWTYTKIQNQNRSRNYTSVQPNANTSVQIRTQTLSLPKRVRTLLTHTRFFDALAASFRILTIQLLSQTPNIQTGQSHDTLSTVVRGGEARPISRHTNGRNPYARHLTACNVFMHFFLKR